MIAYFSIICFLMCDINKFTIVEHPRAMPEYIPI